MSTGKYKGQRNPRGLCSKCAAPITWIKTAEGRWMPVNDREGRVNVNDLFSPTVHASHGATCPAAKEFKAQQAAERATALAADPDMLAATRQLMEARKELEAKWAATAAQVKPRPQQQAVIAKIGKLARELAKTYGIRRDQLQGLARATVGVSGFEHLYAVPVTWLEERLFYALELYAEWFATDATEWDADMPQVLACTQAHFARCCQKRHKALGLKEPGRVEHATESV